jgi:hypothetical protein
LLAISQQAAPLLTSQPAVYALRPAALLYCSLRDTAVAMPFRLTPEQLITARACPDARWALVNNLLATSTPTHLRFICQYSGLFAEWYVRRADLVLVPSAPAATILKPTGK